MISGLGHAVGCGATVSLTPTLFHNGHIAHWVLHVSYPKPDGSERAALRFGGCCENLHALL